MASSVLSLPRLALMPLCTPSAVASQSGIGTSRLSFWCASAEGAASRIGCAADGAESRIGGAADDADWGIGGAWNTGLEREDGASWGAREEDWGACAASVSGRDGIRGQGLWGRREVVTATVGAAVWGLLGGGGEAVARDRRNKKEISPADYLTSGTGIKYFDIEEGKGPVAQKGETVVVHFDCVYKSITAVSSRESKILAGNRTIAEPYELNVGAEPGRERKRDFVENANGLFSAQAAPKPPPALYAVTEGMRVGGRRTVIVPPELGYGEKGLNEIPPGATFDLNIELLEVKKP